MLLLCTLRLHSLKEELFKADLIILMTSPSDLPVSLLMSSKVMRSAQAAQMIQSLDFLFWGCGFEVLVIGLLKDFRVAIILFLSEI